MSTSTKAARAKGTARRKAEPHQNHSRRTPASTEPMTVAVALTADHRAIASVRWRPGAHSAVISDSVVGYAMPAAIPVKMRAATSISTETEKAARMLAMTVRPRPSTSSCLRP